MSLSDFSPANLSARIIGAIAAGIVALLVIWAAWHFWEKSRSQAAQTRVTNAQTGAFTNSSADAINTVANAGQREAQSDDLSRTNEEEIRNAKGANAPVDPAARDAGLRALCRRAAYSSDPKCRVFQSHP